MTIDPMDIAYLAMGAKQALLEHLEKHGHNSFGEAEYIGEVIQYAALMDEVYHEVQDDWELCWAYEVAEPAGAALGRALLEGETITKKKAELLIRSIVNDCMQETVH